MKKSLILILVFISSFRLLAQFEDLTFGTDSTLEVITWNIEHFPKEGQVTVDYVRQIIEALDVDIVAIQELEGYDYFNQLVDSLEGWEGYYGYNQYISLAYIYKADLFEDLEIFEIYENDSREFPRTPLVMEMDYNGEHFVIINNHLKCCGNQILELDDEWDEETRRYDACNLLDQYIVDFHPNDKVIVLGDLNDILTDSPENNVFQVFTENPNSYLIADMDIAEGGSTNWSYPTWPSHIDHIFISNEIVNDYLNYGSDIRTIKLDEYFDGGWSDYDEYISDHRPVGLKIKTENNLGTNEFDLQKNSLSNYPNPFVNTTTISFKTITTNSVIEIFSVKGKLVQQFNLLHNQSSVVWNASALPAGIYYAKLIVDGRIIGVRKMALLN